MTTQDEITQKIKNAADEKFALSAARIALQERRDQALMLPYNGGMFKASTELIAFLAAWSDDELIMHDVYQQPVKVDRRDLLDKLQATYRIVMNDWAQEYHELAQIRRSQDV